jgi:hypothetical protein
MKNKNTFNIAILNDDQCRIEAKCIPIGNSQLQNTSKLTEGSGGNKISACMITSGSLNLSKTISNLSFQTMRVSKASLFTSNLPSEPPSSSKLPVDLDKLISVEVSDGSIDIPVDLSTNSIVFVKKSEQFLKGINYTPSTICNYYEQSNEVTPNKPMTTSNNRLKLDLNDIHVNVSHVEDDGRENVLSSARQGCEEGVHFMLKKTPIKYTKSQLKSADKSCKSFNNVSSPREQASASPMDNMLALKCGMTDSSLNTLTKEVKKEIVVHVSELNIEDKILSGKYDLPLKSHTPKDLLDRKNLNFTFNKVQEIIPTEEKELRVSTDDPIPIPEPIKTLKPNATISKANSARGMSVSERNNSVSTLKVMCLDLEKIKQGVNKKKNNISFRNEGKNDYQSPPVSSTRKMTYHSTNHSNYSKDSRQSKHTATQDSRNKKESFVLSNNSKIKLFLLNLLEEKNKHEGKELSNAVEKIFTQGSRGKPFKKSNSVNHDSARKRCENAINNHTRSHKISFLNLDKKETIKASSTSRTKDGKAKVLEYTVNIDQLSYSKSKKSPEVKYNLSIQTKSKERATNFSSGNNTKTKVLASFTNYTRKLSPTTKKANELTNKIKSIDIPHQKKKAVSSKLEVLLGDDVSVPNDDL